MYRRSDELKADRQLQLVVIGKASGDFAGCGRRDHAEFMGSFFLLHRADVYESAYEVIDHLDSYFLSVFLSRGKAIGQE